MSKIFKFGIGLLAMAGMMWPAVAAVPATVVLKGHVPAVVSQLTPTGVLDANTNLQLAIGLPLHNREDLTNLLQQVYDPSSTNYHHFITPDEFTTRFGPTATDYQAVLDFAATNGLTVTHQHGNRMLVDVTGKVSDIEHAFHVTMHKYHHPKEARDFYAPDTEPSVSAALPVQNIQGLNNYVLPHPFLQKKPASAVSPANGSGPFGGYMGKDFRNAYAPGTTLNGSGQVVGLLQFDGYQASDITTYEGLAGLTNVPLHNVLLDGFDGSAGGNNDEVCLDIETSISMAPALAGVVLFEAGPFGNPDDILNSMAASNTIKQFSASWGYGTTPTTEQIYQQLALQGQTFFNASGDGDAWLGGIPFGSCESPNITIVGGTTLTMSGTGAAYTTERVWNWGFAGGFNWNVDGFVGSSGGVSVDVPIPTWQKTINMTTNLGSTTFRNVPDVSLTGDNVFVVSSGGGEGIFGGTSCASPLWAGFMALINQQAVINNKAPVGFLAPAAYAILNSANFTNCFHDIMTGSNTWDQSPNNFFGVPGYDLGTGIGTPNGTNLINALAGVTATNIPVVVSAPRGPWGTSLSGMDGGNPNGLWFLFVRDDLPINIGVISNGWSVTITSANPVGNAGDNQVYITPAISNATVGVNWTVTLAVTNYGPSISTNVVVTDVIPLGNGTTLAGESPSMGSISQVGNNLIWNVGTLANNAGATLLLSFNSSATGIFTNSAIVVADTDDPNTDDNSASSVVVVGTSVAPAFTGRPTTSSGHFSFQITPTPGTTTVIQESTNLVSWVPVYTTNTSSVISFTDLNTTNVPYRFYRAVATP